MSTRRHLEFAAGLMMATWGCESAPVIPEVWKPLGYGTVAVDLPGCSIPLPPVRDSANCSAADIGKTIAVKDVCRLVVALRDWVKSAPPDAPSVRPADWDQVRAVCVYRSWWVASPHAPPEAEPVPRPTFLTLAADMPNRSQRVFVQMSEQSGQFEFSAGPRGDRDRYAIEKLSSAERTKFMNMTPATAQRRAKGERVWTR